MRAFFLICFFLLSNSVIGQNYLEDITSVADFEKLESKPLSEKYSNVTSVKVVYDIERDKVYFTHSVRFKYHYSFCTEILGFQKGMEYFNEYNYSDSDQREYYLATINHYIDADIFTFEFSTSDKLSEKNILFFQKAKSLVTMGKPLKLFPTEAAQIKFVSSLDPQIEFIKASDVYNNLQYQALHQTSSYGRLHFIDIDNFKRSDVEVNDIIVVNGTPLDVPFCRGMITTSFQPPLSHIVLLSHNRDTPIMALKDAWKDEELRALEGKLVRFTVENDRYEVEKTTKEKAEKYWKKNSRNKITTLDIDREIHGVQSIYSISSKSVNYVGGKAANYGELNKIYLNSEEKLRIPKAGFAIPFYHYLKHVEDNGIEQLICELLEDETIRKDPEKLKKQLKNIRKEIKKAAIDARLLSDVEDIVRQNGIPRLRFRSSTNAEDLDGFNGAGLYDSKTGILDDDKKTIEKAIKKVWASLWNYRAFQERDYFMIDQNSIAMGILVHQSFPDEAVNGVAITKNIYRPERTGFVVNVQKGDVSIVLPPDGVTSEQFILKHNINVEDELEVDYMSYSSLNDNEPLLSIEEVQYLNKTLAAIKQHFYSLQKGFGKPRYDDFAMDVEFKLEAGTRKIIVKQARIY